MVFFHRTPFSHKTTPEQVLWKSAEPSNHPAGSPAEAAADSARTAADPLAPAAPPSAVTLAGWLSCWRDVGAVMEEEEAAAAEGRRGVPASPLFRGVKEGEKVRASFGNEIVSCRLSILWVWFDGGIGVG